MPNRWLMIVLLVVTGSIPGSSETWSRATPQPGADSPSSYVLDVTLNAEEVTIGGLLQLDWVNATGTTQHSLPFRLYPNGEHYGDGLITVSSARADGTLVTPTMADDPTVMTLPLGDAIGPEERVLVDLTFETTIPVDMSGSFGILQHLPE
ncbi:MAG: hypothetical protein M3451_04935, partial [Chloroflexota bacterium]|nr:hypothetical protein [Chloroflexota bacterium]